MQERASRGHGGQAVEFSTAVIVVTWKEPLGRNTPMTPKIVV